MDLRHSTIPFIQPFSRSKLNCRTSRFSTTRSSLPFPPEKAKYHRELRAAVDVVQRACHLCVDVQKSLFAAEARILEKNDSTPVTVADFGVQALVSLELSKLFPSIPLVAEEDSAFLRSNNLANAVVNVVNDVASPGNFTNAEVLDAIDRGGKNAATFGANPATYWVGLALIVQGEIVLGVMGSPNWKENISSQPMNMIPEYGKSWSESGIMMIAHVNCGTWTLRLSDMLDAGISLCSSWTRRFVDSCCLVHKAQFCIADSQSWDLIPLSTSYSATTDANCIGENQILLHPICCGSLCKYLTVASGMTSVFILRAPSQKSIKAWDHAVGMLCVHEAGGKVTDWKGSRLDLAADQAERRAIFPFGGVLVTNRNLHSQIIEMLSFDSTLVS